MQQLQRSEASKLIERARPCLPTAELGRTELPRREIDQSNADAAGFAAAGSADTRQPAALTGVERRIDCCSRREHPCDLAPHHTFSELGILHLLTYGNAVALA